MISCDADFRDLHYQWLAHGKEHAGIIYMSEKRYCKHVSEIVRIVTFWHECTMDENDLYNELWDGDDAQ